jgi:hypothetical protein
VKPLYGPVFHIRNTFYIYLYALIFSVLFNSQIQKYFALVLISFAFVFIFLKHHVYLSDTPVKLGTPNHLFVVIGCLKRIRKNVRFYFFPLMVHMNPRATLWEKNYVCVITPHLEFQRNSKNL